MKEIGQLSPDEEAKFFRSHEGYGIPFGRVGTAKDYAQLMVMVVSVGFTVASNSSQADTFAERVHDRIRDLDRWRVDGRGG